MQCGILTIRSYLSTRVTRLRSTHWVASGHRRGKNFIQQFDYKPCPRSLRDIKIIIPVIKQVKPKIIWKEKPLKILSRAVIPVESIKSGPMPSLRNIAHQSVKVKIMIPAKRLLILTSDRNFLRIKKYTVITARASISIMLSINNMLPVLFIIKSDQENQPVQRAIHQVPSVWPTGKALCFHVLLLHRCIETVKQHFINPNDTSLPSTPQQARRPRMDGLDGLLARTGWRMNNTLSCIWS